MEDFKIALNRPKPRRKKKYNNKFKTQKSISKTNEARQNIYLLDISFPLFFNLSFQAAI